MERSALIKLKADLYTDLRDFVSFFDTGGVDHEHGSFCCGLSHTGARLSGLKFVWFNGRGIWVYSRLHNTGLLRAESAPRGGSTMDDYLLGVARGAVKFVLANGRDADGAWVVETDASGGVLKPAEPNYIPTSGYGSAFIAEGLGEYALATGDASALELALDILRSFITMMDDPNRPGDRGPWPCCYPGMRLLGHHMICLNLARGLWDAVSELRRRGLPSPCLDGNAAEATLAELDLILNRMIDAILGPFVHPKYGLLTETLDHEYARPADANEDLCYLGHAIETMWMLMAEAERREDEGLYARAAALFRRHVDSAWDPLCGGLFRGVYMREWHYLIDADAKVKWEHDEVIVGCLMLLAHPPVGADGDGGDGDGGDGDGGAKSGDGDGGAKSADGDGGAKVGDGGAAEQADGGESMVSWAGRCLRRVLEYNERAFSLRSLRPGSWKVGGDRFAKPEPNAEGISGYNMGCASLPNRVEHYHLPRMLMSGIRLCDEAIAKAAP